MPFLSEKETLSHSGFLKMNSVPAASETCNLKGGVPKFKFFSLFVLWCCGLAVGLVVWVSSDSGIHNFLNVDELIFGDQHTEAKTEESVQSHIGATCKRMC